MCSAQSSVISDLVPEKWFHQGSGIFLTHCLSLFLNLFNWSLASFYWTMLHRTALKLSTSTLKLQIDYVYNGRLNHPPHPQRPWWPIRPLILVSCRTKPHTFLGYVWDSGDSKRGKLPLSLVCLERINNIFQAHNYSLLLVNYLIPFEHLICIIIGWP